MVFEFRVRISTFGFRTSHVLAKKWATPKRRQAASPVSSSFYETACSSYIRPGCIALLYPNKSGAGNPFKYGCETERRSPGLRENSSAEESFWVVVAQVSNLLYRRASSLRTPTFSACRAMPRLPIGNRRYGRLETCATSPNLRPGVLRTCFCCFTHPRKLPNHFIRPMVFHQERESIPLASHIHIQKRQAAGVDDFISLLHGRVLKRLLGLATLSRPDAIAETLIDFEHIRAGVVATLFEFEQERGSSVPIMMRTDEDISRCANRPVLLAQHPETGHGQVRVRERSARHGDHRFEPGIKRGDIDRSHCAERHARGTRRVQRQLAGKSFVGAPVPKRHLVEQKTHIFGAINGGSSTLVGLIGDWLALKDRHVGVSDMIRRNDDVAMAEQEIAPKRV